VVGIIFLPSSSLPFIQFSLTWRLGENPPGASSSNSALMVCTMLKDAGADHSTRSRSLQTHACLFVSFCISCPQDCRELPSSLVRDTLRFLGVRRHCVLISEPTVFILNECLLSSCSSSLVSAPGKRDSGTREAASIAVR
jgi:hypothetical protein